MSGATSGVDLSALDELHAGKPLVAPFHLARAADAAAGQEQKEFVRQFPWRALLRSEARAACGNVPQHTGNARTIVAHVECRHLLDEPADFLSSFILANEHGRPQIPPRR